MPLKNFKSGSNSNNWRSSKEGFAKNWQNSGDRNEDDNETSLLAGIISKSLNFVKIFRSIMSQFFVIDIFSPKSIPKNV